MPEEKIKILLLDDDEIDRLAVQRFVQREQLPYELDLATSIVEARQRLKTGRYDLVMLDYNLPDGTGLDVLTDVGDMPAIFITGSGDEKIAVKAMRHGAYDYLIKDPERNYLIVLPTTIANVLERKRAEKALVESEIKHRLLLDSIQTPTLALKEDMTIFYCNQAYARLVEKTLAELEGKNLLNVFPKLRPSKTYEAYQKVLATGQIQEVEGRFGDRFYRSRIFRTPWGMLAIAEDVTERKKAQEALVRYNEELERRVAERTADLARANEDLERSYNDTIKAIIAAMDAKDSYTRGHSEKVRKIALSLGRTLGLADRELKRLEYAALLHDIGKIGISDLLLTKRSGLTGEEYSEIKQHSEIGSRLVEQVELLKDVGHIIAAHHEWWDGSGYPRGLVSESIPAPSRIISIADAYEAMTADRPYRKAFSHPEALQRLRQSSGTQFDPFLVDLFIALSERDLQ
ncbi:MAG: HD domain-containing protein [Candidatus Edwardsbacteria bacterium]|nr:HD domain-containing protein [Candidatus Edwardsbacteria bacterium]